MVIEYMRGAGGAEEEGESGKDFREKKDEVE